MCQILDALTDPCTGLAEIKQEVAAIECKLDNPEYGLAEIKAEIREILSRLEQCCNGGGNCPTEFEVMTTGPMFKANQASSVIAQVLNYFSEPVTVTIGVFSVSLTGTKSEVPGSPTEVTLGADESFAQAYDISDSVAYEVIFTSDNPEWLRYWSGSRTQPANVALTSSTILPENIVLHADFVRYPLAP